MRRRGAPITTVALVLAAVAVALVPALQRWLVLDRAAVGAGQLWRLATGSLVHFSTSHLLLDVVAVAVPGALLELDGRRIGTTVAIAAVTIGVAVLAFDPRVALYGGLSGIAFTLVVLCALHVASRRGIERAVGLVVLALTAGKLCWEMRSGAFLLVGSDGGAFVPVPVSHLAGSAVGLVAFLRRRPPARAARAALLSRTLPSH